MGINLFGYDLDVQRGWDSFVNNELKNAQEAIDQGWKEATQPFWERDSTPELIGEDNAAQLKTTITEEIPAAIEQGWEEAQQPFWERDSTPELIGEDNAAQLKDTVNNVKETVTKETEKITETVKETVNNVTKGVSDALPIVAIGAAAVIGLSLLLGRR